MNNEETLEMKRKMLCAEMEMNGMKEDKYWVKVDGIVIAENMTLEFAIILVKAIFETYYNDLNMVIGIGKVEVKE